MTTTSVTTKTVVIADDTAFVRDRFRTALENAGHKAIAVKSAAELLARVRADLTQIDLIVLDLRLPHAPGVDLVRSIRKLDDGRLPVLIFSGTIASADEVHELAAMGVAGYINEYSAVQHILPSIAPHLFPDNFNRRASPRVVLGIPIQYRFGNTIAAALTLNLSHGGIAIRTTSPLDSASKVKVRFRMPGSKRDIDAEGRVTVRKTRIDQLIAEGHRGARAVRRAVSSPERFIAATQLGITMASLGLGWIGEPALASMIQPAFSVLPAFLAETTAHTIAVALAFAIVTALHITLGELAPKTIALEHSEATALWVVNPTELFMRVFWPFIRLLNGTGKAVVRSLGLRGPGRHALVHSEEELKMLVTASQEAGVLEEHEEQMLHRVFDFADLTAGQVMIPRTELIAVPGNLTRNELVTRIAGGRLTRLPVYRRDLDDVIGMLHVTDVLKTIVSGQDVDAASIAREAVTVPETLGADDLLAEMRRRRVAAET